MNNDIEIRETTIRRIGTTRVGMSNIWEREVEFPDGSKRKALSCILGTNDREDPFIVAVGSHLEIGGISYEVVTLQKRKVKSELGRVVLRSLPKT